MTKRGLQIGGQFRYLFGDGRLAGSQSAKSTPKILPHDRVTDTSRYALAWKHNQQFAPWLGGFRQRQQGVRRHLLRRFRRPGRDDVAEDAAARRRAASRQRPVVAARAGAELPDAAGPEQRRSTPPYNRLPQVLRDAAARPIGMGFTWSGTGEFARFRQAALTPTGDRARALSARCAGSRRGPRVVLHARRPALH